jgi:hypothetical protein
MTTYRSPLCLDIIESSEFTRSTWVRCSCGHWFTEETLVEFASAREKLSAAQKRFADIRETAKLASEEHALNAGASIISAHAAKAPTATSYEPAQTAAYEPKFQPAPVAVQEVLPQRERNLPTLSTSQWLLTVMAGLIGIALTIFFSVTWNDLPALAKIGVVGALTVGFSFGAMKAKKYFVALANVLAIIASVTTFIGLQSLSRYGILPQAWSDSQYTPYVSIMLAIVTAGSLFMGRRFKIWGWLIIAPVGTAVSAILFTYYFMGQALTDGYNHAGYQIAVLSAAILGVVAVARFTRLETPEVPSLPKAKKDQTDDLKKEIVEAEYQFNLHSREQNSLSLAAKFSNFAILGYLAFLAGSIATQLFPQIKNIAGQDFLGVDPVGLIIAAALWVTGASLLNRYGPAFTSNGEITPRLANFTWVTAFSITAFAISYSALWVASGNYFALLIVGALAGSVMIFAQTFISKISADIAARLGSLVGSVVLWGTSLSLWAFTEGEKSTNELVTFSTIVSIALLVRSAVFSSVRTAYFSSATYFLGLVIFITTYGGNNTFLNLAISLAATGAWTVALTMLQTRIGISSRLTSGLQSAAVGLFAVIALGSEADTFGTNQTLDVLPLLEVLTGFGLVFMALALIPAFRSIEELRKTLAYSSFILLGAGFIPIFGIALSSIFGAANLFAVASGYTLLVIAVLAVYGTMAKRAIALKMGLVFTTLLALSTSFWSFEWSSSFATPAVFMAILGLGLFLHSKLFQKLDESLVEFNKVYYPLSFGILAASYLVKEVSSGLEVLNYSFLAFAVFGALNYLVASGKILKIADESKRSFDLVAGLTLAITAAQSIVRIESASLIRFAILSVLVATLLTITKRSVIRELDAWIASSVLVQLAVIGQLASDQAVSMWLIELPAISMLLSGYLYISARARVRKSSGKAEFSFAPRLLPSRILAVSVFSLASSFIVGLYAPYFYENDAQSIAVPLTVAIYLLVSGLFISRRWSKNISEDADKAVSRTMPIIYIVGFIALLQAKAATGGFLFIWLVMYMSLWSAVYFAGIAVLSYLTAIYRKSPVQAFAGYAAGLLATFFVVSDININNRAFKLDSLLLLAAIGLFVLTTSVLRKIGHTFNKIGFPIMLPVSIFLATISSAFSLLLGNNFDSYQVNTVVIYIEIIASLGLAAAALFMSRGQYLGEQKFTRVPMLLSAALLYLYAYGYIGVSAEYLESQIREVIVGAVLFAALSVFIRRFRAPISVYLALLASLQLAFSAGAVLVAASTGLVDYQSEIIVLIAAIAVATVTPKLAELYSDRWKTILRQGLPLAVFLVPGVFTVYSVLSSNFEAVAQFKLIEAIALVAITVILLVVGVRLGNLGISIVSGAFLAVTVIPILWQSVTQITDDRTRFELQTLFVGILLFGILAGIRATFKVEMNSILYLGVPSLIAILPTLFGVVGRLGGATEEATSADWIRLGIVLAVSVVFLLLGAVRKLAGFFVPGGVALIVTVIPLLWTRMTSLGSSFIVIGLLLLAALIGFVAVRLEQVKGSARSANKWLRELK